MLNLIVHPCLAESSVVSQGNTSEQINNAAQAISLSKRFRIDHLTDEINLLIQRKFSSSPVVLITPDGTKWYSERHPDNVTWMDGLTGDIISIKNPTPGPYQLLGQVVNTSMIVKASQLNIAIEALPKKIYRGEVLKSHASLIGDEQLIRMPGFDFLIEWQASLISDDAYDSNSTIGNFDFIVYNDHGETLDSIPDDGIFTGVLNLDKAPGKYQLVVTAKNKAFIRKNAVAIEILPSPIMLTIDEPEDHEFGLWKLSLQIDDNEVLAAETHVALEIYGPNNTSLNMMVEKLVPGENFKNLNVIKEFGGYRLAANISTKTLSGRELLINIPQIYFNKVKPEIDSINDREKELLATKTAIAEQKQSTKKAQIIAVAVNVIMLFVGLMVFLVRRSMRKRAEREAQAELAAKKKAEEEELEKQKKAEKENIYDDIDLSLPETSKEESSTLT